ncbi:MAG TPA: hypothetical protein VF255_10050, partial [Solirubrobacterales bacterium]
MNQSKSLDGRSVRWLIVFLLLLCGSAVAPVVAASGTEDPVQAPAEAPPGADLPSEAEVATALEQSFDAFQDEQRQRRERLATPAVAGEREASRHAYADLSPEEAQELLQSHFAPILEALDKDPSRYLSDAKLENPLGPDAATVTSGGETTLLETSLPVQAEDEDGDLSKVDVSLVKGEDGWEPVNPLVDLEIGATVEEGVELADAGVTITQAGAEDSVARPLEDKNLFYGEVSSESDTDLLVSPTSTGVELFNLLRSADSPEDLRFHVGIPSGATLRGNEAGAAEVLDADGNLLVLIAKPWAIDAQGTNVPVEMTVEGASIVLGLNHR